jgi:hypothetical protein
VFVLGGAAGEGVLLHAGHLLGVVAACKAQVCEGTLILNRVLVWVCNCCKGVAGSWHGGYLAAVVVTAPAVLPPPLQHLRPAHQLPVAQWCLQDGITPPPLALLACQTFVLGHTDL